MAAFFVRGVVGGVATWFVATFVFYSLLVSPGIPTELQPCSDCPTQPIRIYIQRALFTYMLDKPWPANYLAWLFDSSGTTVKTVTVPGEQGWGYVSPKTFTLARSSLLAGDFGYSWEVATGAPTLDVYGFDPRVFPFALAILLSFMLIATLQRRHRSRAWRSTRIPANARWRPAELWTTS